jgi:CDP-paratose 2-epimerase
MNGYSLITGGAGFIGVSLAHRLLTSGRPVLLFDNLSRPGSRRNFEWLKQTHGSSVQLQVADVRDRIALRQALGAAEDVYHFAAQVAVTTSLRSPSGDFDVNARGSLNVLEEIRRLDDPPPLLFTSTNKVYGSLENIGLRRNGGRREPSVPRILEYGISEDQPLDFQSPYGCSKGAADQYVLDYARNFGLPALVFRMSCIYGAHQQGTEDQGWVAHFMMRALDEQPITIYGDGTQTRDLLYIDDLVEAMLLARRDIKRLAGQVFNIGGGPGNTASLLEMLKLTGETLLEPPMVRFAVPRPGDQRYYVSDTRRFQAATGWAPAIGIRDGLAKMYDWLVQSAPVPVQMRA